MVAGMMLKTSILFNVAQKVFHIYLGLAFVMFVVVPSPPMPQKSVMSELKKT